MDDIVRTGGPGRLAHEPDAHGLFFSYHFDRDGFATDEPGEAFWSWRSYDIGDVRARKEITQEATLPEPVREAFLSSGYACHVDLERTWLYGDLPDLRHDYSKEARGLGHFRFALNERMLIGARKQPLRSVDAIRRMIDTRSRPFRSPAELIEEVMNKSLEGIGGELIEISEDLDGIEDRIVSDAWNNERQALVDVRRKLVTIHRQMASLTNLFRHLDQAHRHDLAPSLADMAARLSHQSFVVNHDSEQLQGRARLLQDELMAKLTAQSNRLLYLLSVMTAVLLPMTIISGLFGMNVGGLPLLENHGGFWIVIVLSVVVAIATLYFVRRLGDGR